MPKVEVDYSNTIFYKIYCINPEITDMYIGHTTNFVQRKHAHKQSCINMKCLSYNCKLYNYIREHGGWNNWIMEIIAFRNCEDHYTARKCEQEYFKEYKATLNSIEPLPTPKIKKEKLHCNTCNIYFKTTTLHELHNNTNKHINRTFRTKKMPKNAELFSCIDCNFKCSKHSNWNKHILTAKHINRTNRTNKMPKVAETFDCECGKVYKARNSLWYHKKKCNYIETVNDVNEPIDTPVSMNINDNQPNLVLELLRENQEFKQLMVEQNKQMQDTQSLLQQTQTQMIEICKEGKTINNTTNNNTQFNLNFFLNDTCKDAMNINDFLGNMNVNIEEIEYIGHHGYVNGMTKLIMDRLKDMDITKRPIHCTDIKRETMYIKDQNEWCKDTDELTKLRKILTRITMNNYRTVPQWKTAHPKCEEMDTRDYNFCYKMMRVILGDVEEEQVRLDNKIIKTMSKGLFCK